MRPSALPAAAGCRCAGGLQETCSLALRREWRKSEREEEERAVVGGSNKQQHIELVEEVGYLSSRPEGLAQDIS